MWLELLNAGSGSVLTVSSTNTGGGLDEKIEFTPTAGVEYLVRVSSETQGERGLYEVSLFRIPPSIPVIGFPDTQAGSLSSADELDPLLLPGSQFYKRDYRLDAPSGVDVVIRMESAQLDAFLSVVNAENGRVLAQDDDSGGGLNAMVVFNPQPGVAYYVRASTSGELETGSYVVSTQGAVPSETLALGSVEEGVLSTADGTDPRFAGTYYIDDYDLTGVTGGQRVILDQTSGTIDSYLQLINKTTGVVLNENDDYGDSLGSRILFTVQPGVSYVARASSALEAVTGIYRVSLQPLQTIGRTATVNGQLTSSDAIDHRFVEIYRMDDYELTGVSPGQVITATLSSTQVDSYLTVLNRDTGETIAEDDDGGGGLNARTTFTAQAGVVYLIRATTALPGETGAYTLRTQ